jgi:hypothetical protein
MCDPVRAGRGLAGFWQWSVADSPSFIEEFYHGIYGRAGSPTSPAGALQAPSRLFRRRPGEGPGAVGVGPQFLQCTVR